MLKTLSPLIAPRTPGLLHTPLPTRSRALLRPPAQCPAPPQRQGSEQAAGAVLAPLVVQWPGVCVFAPLPMAISTAPRCEICALVMHGHPDGIKAYGHEPLTVCVGRCGKPFRKLRYIPTARAHELARMRRGRFGATVAVAWGWA